MSDPRYASILIYPRKDERELMYWLKEYLEARGDKISRLAIEKLLPIARELRAKEATSKG